MKQLVAWILIIGALNWGLVGLMGLNVVEMVLGGSGSMLTKIVYIIVGLAGVYKVYMITMGGKK